MSTQGRWWLQHDKGCGEMPWTVLCEGRIVARFSEEMLAYEFIARQVGKRNAA